MSEPNPYPFDYIAIGPHGVYAIASDMGDRETQAFIKRALARGHRVERVPVAEAVERHIAFLNKASPPLASLSRTGGQ